MVGTYERRYIFFFHKSRRRKTIGIQLFIYHHIILLLLFNFLDNALSTFYIKEQENQNQIS